MIKSTETCHYFKMLISKPIFYFSKVSPAFHPLFHISAFTAYILDQRDPVRKHLRSLSSP